MKTAIIIGIILAIPVAYAQSVTGSGVIDTVLIVIFSAFIFFLLRKIMKVK